MKNLPLLPALIVGLGLMPAGPVTGQTFTNLHVFVGSNGSHPSASFILSDDILYGTTYTGGSLGQGTVFRVNTDGTGFTNLYSFAQRSGSDPFTNTYGSNPEAGLILSDNKLYGTAAQGGSSGCGTVFAVNTDGNDFAILHTFSAVGFRNSNSDGANPYGGLALLGNQLFGTASSGGLSGKGTVFKINTDGTGFTNLHSFVGSDGSAPFAGLILSGNTLYGTTGSGGSWGQGTVFKVNDDGTGFTNLHSFSAVAVSGPYGSPYTNSDGAFPRSRLILSGNNLYGTALNGGSSGNGTIFKVNTNGSDFTILHIFTALSGFYPNYTNSDGAGPYSELFLSGNALYGTTDSGGSLGQGTVFKVNPDGTGFTNLYSFTALNNYTNSDGASPRAGLILSGNTLYGTAYGGGSFGAGTVFSLSLPPLPPHLAIIPSAANVILTWPTNIAGFTLQSATNLVPPAVWATVSAQPVVVNGQNAVTNPITGTQQFYRLSQ